MHELIVCLQQAIAPHDADPCLAATADYLIKKRQNHVHAAAFFSAVRCYIYQEAVKTGLMHNLMHPVI